MVFDFTNKTLSAFEEIPSISDKLENNAIFTEDDAYGYFVLYDSSGSSTYKAGKMTNAIDGDDTTIEGNMFEGNFEHPYVNVGYNLLKAPEPIAWGTGGAA